MKKACLLAALFLLPLWHVAIAKADHSPYHIKDPEPQSHPSNLGFSNTSWSAETGFLSGTPGGTNFAMNFHLDWQWDKDGRLSIGPMIQLVPPGSFSQVAGAMVARYKIGLEELGCLCQSSNKKNRVFLTPFIGMGGLHSELKSNQGVSTDLSYFVPIGLSLEYAQSDAFGISASYVANMHDIKFSNRGDHDRSSHGFFFGVTFRPSF